MGHEASSGELSRDFGHLDRSGVGAVLFDDFCGWCAHRNIGADFADSDEEDVGRTAHYALRAPQRQWSKYTDREGRPYYHNPVRTFLCLRAFYSRYNMGCMEGCMRD